MGRGSGISPYQTRGRSSRQHDSFEAAPAPAPASPSPRKRGPGRGSGISTYQTQGRSSRQHEAAPAPPASPPPHRVIHNAGDQEADAGDQEADSDSDDDLMQEVADGPIDVRSVIEVMIDATVTRISPVTRKLYDSHLRQMAVWCLTVCGAIHMPSVPRPCRVVLTKTRCIWLPPESRL